MADANTSTGDRPGLEPETRTWILTQRPAAGLWPSMRISLRFTLLLGMLRRVHPPLWGGNGVVEARTLVTEVSAHGKHSTPCCRGLTAVFSRKFVRHLNGHVICRWRIQN